MSEALRLADQIERGYCLQEGAHAIRRLDSENQKLRETNEDFGKRQEWWNERMFDLEMQRKELLEALKQISDESSGRIGVGFIARAAIAKAEGEK